MLSRHADDGRTDAAQALGSTVRAHFTSELGHCREDVDDVSAEAYTWCAIPEADETTGVWWALSEWQIDWRVRLWSIGEIDPLF